MDESAEHKKPTYVNLIVKALEGDEVYFNVLRNSDLKRVLIVSCDRLSLKLSDTDFLFEGRYVLPEETPDQLKMKNGDVIKAIPGEREHVRNQDDDDLSNPTYAHININVLDQAGNKIIFRMKRNTQLKKLMDAYCDRKSVEIDAIAFLFDGHRLRDEHTPDELEMEDGDEIDAILHQYE